MARRQPGLLTKLKRMKGPAPEEWDFTDCEPEEAEFCRFYEYARHDDRLKAEIAKHRAQNRWASGYSPRDDIYYRTEYKLRFFEFLVDFPEKPWLKIKENLRKKACDNCQGLIAPFIDAGPDRIYAAENEIGEDGKPVGPDFEYPYFPKDVGLFSFRSVHVVEIDWTTQDATIVTEFRNFLKRARKLKEPTKEARGGLTEQKLLKYLGASRLMRHFEDYSASEILDYTLNVYGIDEKRWYESAEALKDAAKKAENLIQNGVIIGPLAEVAGTISNSQLTALEKARAKVRLGQLNRAEARKLLKLDHEAQLAALLRDPSKLAPQR